jgi:hypothetical protein
MLNELSTTPWRRMGERIYRSTFVLSSAVAVGEWSASRPGLFTTGERAPGTHWIGGWVDPRTGPDDLEKRKFWPYRDSNTRPLSRPARSQSLYRLRYPASVTLCSIKLINFKSLKVSKSITIYFDQCDNHQVLQILEKKLLSSVVAYAHACLCWWDVFSLVVCCAASCSRMHTGTLAAHACLCWWDVYSLVVCCAACLVLECKQVLSMRMRVCVGGICSLLFCVVLRVLFSNVKRYSRCACVFVLVGCVLSCSCVVLCVLFSQRSRSPHKTAFICSLHYLL